MKIHYHLTEEDFVNFNLYHSRHSKAASKALKMQRFISPILFMAAAFLFSKMGEIPLPISLSTFGVMSILWVLFYPKYFYQLIKRNAKKMIKEGKNDGLLGDHKMMMTDEGIVDTTSIGETRVSWSGITQWKEDAHYFYLYNSAVSAYILPKRELEDFEKTKAFLQAKIN
ncbi:YcxB family protein [Sporosarcina sp. 179-K 3D1 HS]|uniref:YcxB family protein n=1 Tax=Sporosarcina sp. 179-K 3D1 HS TaxID=3232169 RepID=UPI0039A1D7A0